jgi:hypothetical protein
MAAELADYIETARGKHFSDEEIQAKLAASGWSKEQIAEALSHKNELPVPPPPPITGHADVWTGILYLLFFISLYVLAFSVGGIFYVWIDKITTHAIPVSTAGTNINTCPSGGGEFGPLCNLDPNYIGPVPFGFDTISAVRSYMAAIIVCYPVFVILSILIKKQVAKQPSLKNLRPRKIFINITVLVTFLILIGDIITAWYNFLGGNFTDSIIRHTIIIFLISGSLFVYFLSEVKNAKNNT